ncbi:hypothetical protein ACFWWT_32285 [Streptomyces sp. NPDC058676]|uniref:hypothetical protein n=1 Tax=unclassified Streptomyces TaxID=2593676 RepID=UPI00365CFD4E
MSGKRHVDGAAARALRYAGDEENEDGGVRGLCCSGAVPASAAIGEDGSCVLRVSFADASAVLVALVALVAG